MTAILQLTGPVLDLVYQVRALPRRGEEAVVTGFSTAPGGGFNAMAAARAAGAAVRLGGTLGTGPIAETILGRLAALGIALARPRLADRDQGCCTVLVEPDGERTFVGAPGAEGEIGPGALDDIDLSGVAFVLLSGYTLSYPGARAAVLDWTRRLPKRVGLIFDPSPLVGELPRDALAPVLDRADWISANAAEAAILAGGAEPERAARALSRGRGGALVRRGAEGCVLARHGGVVALSAHRVAPGDTNGAGDCHIGSFAAELARGADPVAAARYATIAAALSTLRAGPATPPARGDVLPHMTTPETARKTTPDIQRGGLDR